MGNLEWPEQAEVNLCMWIQFEYNYLVQCMSKSPCKDQEDFRGSELALLEWLWTTEQSS